MLSSWNKVIIIIHAYCIPWCVQATIRVEAKSGNASESQNKIKGQISAK